MFKKLSLIKGGRVLERGELYKEMVKSRDLDGGRSYTVGRRDKPEFMREEKVHIRYLSTAGDGDDRRTVIVEGT